MLPRSRVILLEHDGVHRVALRLVNMLIAIRAVLTVIRSFVERVLDCWAGDTDFPAVNAGGGADSGCARVG